MCPWDDTTDSPSSAIAILNIELDQNVQGIAKACVDYWNVLGGACGASMGATKTLRPLLDAWVPNNFGHFKYVAGTYRIPNGYQPAPGEPDNKYIQPVKGLFAYIP
jgi:hypothetical protein